ncbi:MAG: TetR family transcriptional regulator C-terminal domain-containing protein [Hyphomicrobiales bacterium]
MSRHPAVKARFERVTAGERRARLIDASIECLAKSGIQGFTVDNICREAGTSRGLISHHFGSKDALLAATYSAIYDRVLRNLGSLDSDTVSLTDLIETVLSDTFLNSKYLNVWLALWAEIAVNPALKAEHRKHYALYRESIARAVSNIAKVRGIKADSYEIATAFISLVDGLWLEQCLDATVLSSKRARQICMSTLEASLR